MRPEHFAEPAKKLNACKDLVFEGEKFCWEKGKGNYKPLPKYRPYTHQPAVRAKTKKTRKRIDFDGAVELTGLLYLCDGL